MENFNSQISLLFNNDSVLRCYTSYKSGVEGVTCYFNGTPYFRRFYRQGGSRLTETAAVNMIIKHLHRQGKLIHNVKFGILK